MAAGHQVYMYMYMFDGKDPCKFVSLYLCIYSSTHLCIFIEDCLVTLLYIMYF